MTDIKARLDEIAKEAAELNYSYRNERVIRAAIDKALEVVLTAEPSEGMRRRGNEAIGLESPARPSHVYRAMSSALLEELKK